MIALCMPTLRIAVAAVLAAVTTVSAHADWKPTERIEHYAITGSTGLELYRSIGERGPTVGVGRAIAYTIFDLKWSRDYRPQKNGSCTLVTARPHLILTYHMPKAPAELPAETRSRWERFIGGITAHEKVHGDIIIDMVKEIEAISVGLNAPNDPDCQKVRAELQSRLGPLSVEQRRRSKEFDRVEMSQGGNVHQLVIGLVRGG